MSELRTAAPSRVGLVAAFLAIYVIWGSTYLAIRIVLESLPAFLTAGVRFLTAGAILYVWARLRGAEKAQPIHWRNALVVGTLLFLGGNGGVVWAEQTVSSGLAALMIATEPMWIVLLSWLLSRGPRPGVKSVLGLAVGFTGVALLMGAGTEGGGLDPVGATVLVLSALSWAMGSLYSPRAAFPSSQVLATALTMLCGGAVLVLAGLLNGEAAVLDLGGVTLRSVLAFGYLTIFGSIVAFSAYRWLLEVTTPARVSTYAYVNPAVAVLLGWALASEPIGPRTLMAGGIIVVAVALIITDSTGHRPRQRSAPQQSREPALEADPAAA